MQLVKDLDTNIASLKKTLSSDDVTFLDLKISKARASLVFVNDLIDKNYVGELVLKPAATFKGKLNEKNLFNSFFSPEKKMVTSKQDLLTDLLLGNAILLVDGLKTAFSFGLKFFEKRAISEPPTSTVIKGPREGFVECLPVNVSLMRRKLKTPNLKFENLTVGEFSKTPVALCYLKGVADDKLVEQLKKKISQIKIDAVLDSSYISKYLGEHEVSIFKQVGNTEKPDILAGKILEGRVAIFVDGSPIALSVPYLLIEDFQSASDYYNSPYSATVARFLRLLSVIFAIIYIVQVVAT